MQVYPRGAEKLGPLSRGKLVASGKSGGGALKSTQTGESSSSGKTAPRRETRDVYYIICKSAQRTLPTENACVDGDSLALSLFLLRDIILRYLRK